jgi:ribosome maturation factor RimP
MSEQTSSSKSQDLLSKVEALAQDVLAREGCVLYDVEFTSHAGQRVLRVYIDKADAPVGVDDCANVSRGLNLLLDVEDLVPGGRYSLEVSSPGLERALKKPQHFDKVVGQKIWLKIDRPLAEYGVTDTSIGTAKQAQVDLLAVDPQRGIRIQVSSPHATSEVELPWSAVEKAKTIFEPQKNQGNRPHGSKSSSSQRGK